MSAVFSSAQRQNWKHLLGIRLRELRTQAHGGKGYSQQKAAATIQRTEAYLNRLETRMESENPTIGMLQQLCDLYGVDIGELFRPLVRDTREDNPEAKAKLDFIFASGTERQRITIMEILNAMYERVKKVKKEM